MCFISQLVDLFFVRVFPNIPRATNIKSLKIKNLNFDGTEYMNVKWTPCNRMPQYNTTVDLYSISRPVSRTREHYRTIKMVIRTNL
jgi:hypothetical protein